MIIHFNFKLFTKIKKKIWIQKKKLKLRRTICKKQFKTGFKQNIGKYSRSLCKITKPPFRARLRSCSTRTSRWCRGWCSCCFVSGNFLSSEWSPRPASDSTLRNPLHSLLFVKITTWYNYVGCCAKKQTAKSFENLPLDKSLFLWYFLSFADICKL